MRRCFFAPAWHNSHRSAHHTRLVALGAGPREIGPPRAGWDLEEGPPAARREFYWRECSGAGPRGAVPRREGAPGLGWTRVLRARGRVLGARGGDWGAGLGGAGPRAGSRLQGGSWRGRFLGARGGDWRRVLGVRVLWAARAGVLRSSRARPLKSPRRAASPARAAAVPPAPRPKSAGWDRGHGGGRRPQRLSGTPGAGRGRRRG